MDVSQRESFSMESRGEVTIESIEAARGNALPKVRGHLWLCMDGTNEFPGPHWVGGTFEAEVHLRDQLHNQPNGIQVTAGKLTAVRTTER
jgi:hypothetical protein